MKEKILIVDDALFMRKTIRRILEKNEYTNLIEAADGETALEIFRSEKPDVVLLDITMPGISGMDVLEEIMRIDGRAKVIICSALGQDAMIQKAICRGALDFVVKPFDERVLITVVNGACGR